MLYKAVQKQAGMLAYIDAFHVEMMVLVFIIPWCCS